MSRFRLDCDVAVRTVEDAAGIKFPTVVCHALDGSLVLAGEGHTRQSTAAGKRPTPDARHAVWNSHTCKPATVGKRITPDSRHAVWNSHACQHAATVEYAINVCHS